MKRVEGQIWIDRNLPNRLKYHTGGEDYVVETSSSYPTALNVSGLQKGQTILPAGLLVKLDSDEGVAKASFPDDLENILGVLTTDVKVTEDGGSSSAVVSRSGYLTIDEPWRVFKEFESLASGSTDANYKSKLPATYSTMIGKPVYWYIGKTTVSSGASGKYTSPEGNEGKLTFNTPVGFEWKTGDDSSLNIAYDNLPQVGTLVKIESGKVYLHLNFSKFDSTIEWTWPGVHSVNSDCGLIRATQTSTIQDGSTEILIRHGLFANSSNAHNARSFCNIVALKKHELEDQSSETIEEEEYLIQAPVTNKTGGADRYTKITISSPETLFYRISGRISYKFDKGKGNN